MATGYHPGSAGPEGWVYVLHTSPINTRRSFWRVWSGHGLEKTLLLSKYLERRGSVLSRLSLRAYENGGTYLTGTGTQAATQPNVGESRDDGPRAKIFIQN